MPAPTDTVLAYATEFHTALRARTVLEPLSQRDPSLVVDDAYAISLEVLRRRLAEGERVIGKKIGVTSKAVQDMLGVHEPDFGFLTDRMAVTDGRVSIGGSGLIQPRAEAEVAFILSRRLRGPGVDADDVLAATASVAPCFEIVDSRIRDWKIGIVDTVADNASCGVFALGEGRIDPRSLDLPSLRVTVRKNGALVAEGLGSAVQGSPLQAVAWLANTLGTYGVTLDEGDVILSGSLVPLLAAAPGDRFEMKGVGLGSCTLEFVP